MSEYVARNVSVIDFSNSRGIRIPQIYHLPSSIIKLKHQTIDIGSNCYSVREINKNGVASKVVKNSQNIWVIRVSLASLEEKRIELLQKLIEYMAHLARSASQQTAGNTAIRLLSFFRFYWSQSDLDYFQPENRVHYAEAARRYSACIAADNNLSCMAKKQANIYPYFALLSLFTMMRSTYLNTTLFQTVCKKGVVAQNLSCPKSRS